MRAEANSGTCLATQLDANPALTLRTITSRAFCRSRCTGKMSIALHPRSATTQDILTIPAQEAQRAHTARRHTGQRVSTTTSKCPHNQ